MNQHERSIAEICSLIYFGRKTVGSKKRNITATTRAAIARMNAPVANLAHICDASGSAGM